MTPSTPAPLIALLLAIVLAAGGSAAARAEGHGGWNIPAHGVVALEQAHLDPEYWVARLGQAADRPWLDPEQIARQNAELVRLDETVRDVAAVPRTLRGDDVRDWIRAASARPDGERYDVQGQALAAEFFDALERNLALDAVPETQPTPFGLVVRRADLRAFPDATRVFRERGETNIDRFQESALFPGDAVAVAHASADGEWLFVVSDRYMAWIERDAVAIGDYDTVTGYASAAPSLIVTGATARTVFNPERADVSELQLDMGVRVPLHPDWPADRAVHGQHPAFGHVVQLPARRDDGSLELVPALLPRTAEVAAGPLPLTPANLIRQSFKFLGERYGWGHSYNARDCSGFLTEVYRSRGVQIPRNTSRQSVSPALDKTRFTAADGRDARMAEVARLQVGDMIFIPGHVMMVIGREDGTTWLIHDTAGINYIKEGEFVRMPLHGVAVTPLEPLMSSRTESVVDRITSIVRVR
ncbi:MAG: NlpC-P60 family protein [Gammaproteobacteria bacterium]|nr:NlpC-P60 family protein [Gammaproteobacteria bacterium]